MTNIAARLDRALRLAGIPIQGVSIGSPADRTTWQIHFAPEATAQHRVDGEALRATFNPASPEVVAADLSNMAQGISRQKDKLADCAMLVRARNIPTWNNMTSAQKVAATFAEADVWKGIREFIDDKL